MQLAIVRISFYVIVMVLAALSQAHAATLKGSEIHVSGDVVTIGEIFDGLTAENAADADAEVAKAPPAGKTIALDSGMLYGLATLHHIAWAPHSAFDRIIIIRDSGANEAAGAAGGSASSFSAAAPDLGLILPPLKVALALQTKLAADKLDVVLDSGAQQHLLAGIPADTALTVENLNVATAGHHFTATLVNAATGERYAVAGKSYILLDVPVPAHKIAEGDTIRADDLASVQQRDDQLRSDTIVKADTLIGKVAKRQLEASLPVQERNIGLPVVIKRGDLITMIVTGNGITLTAEGRALSDAGMGESVKLANAASNRTVEGITTGPNTATVRTNTAIVAAVNPVAIPN
jgi:flagella basal body P-ring formation protein FlgA